jgi:hypothetical protein
MAAIVGRVAIVQNAPMNLVRMQKQLLKLSLNSSQ